MKLITILGPTATGKTKLAAHLAYRINGEIISADSRQVFKRMNIGTGKDYKDYNVEGFLVPYHIVDIAEPGDEFSVFYFQKEFVSAFNNITSRNKVPLMCGGTGLYIESILRKYSIPEVIENIKLRKELSEKSECELTKILSGLKKLHNTTDLASKERIIKAIEIEYFIKENPDKIIHIPEFESHVFGIKYEREEVRQRITLRLKERLENGMIDEVKSLLNEGIKTERLLSYGLEYRYLTQFILGEINYEDMFSKLNTEIHRFAKRQMTWFRRMEKNGIKINWIDGDLPVEEKVKLIVGKAQL